MRTAARSTGCCASSSACEISLAVLTVLDGVPVLLYVQDPDMYLAKSAGPGRYVVAEDETA